MGGEIISSQNPFMKRGDFHRNELLREQKKSDRNEAAEQSASRAVANRTSVRYRAITLIYPNHRLTFKSQRRRGPRSLEPIVRGFIVCHTPYRRCHAGKISRSRKSRLDCR